MQEATEPTTSTYVPVLGHSATHVPLWRKGVLADVQLKQFELDAPLQVPHVGSQVWQFAWLSAYFPSGMHEATHVPPSKNGWDEAQVRQSDAAGPEHVAHVASHATQVSLDVGLLPEQVNPA